MAKSQDAKKNVKKEPAKTAKEKKADKIREAIMIIISVRISVDYVLRSFS